jgi:hypothetical protein
MRTLSFIMAILFVIYGNLFGQVNLDSCLIAYYPFNGNANDESGNNNHGTVIGASLSSDRFNNSESAYAFDGINDYIDIGLLKELSGAFEISISIWINKFSSDRYEGFIGRWNTDSENNNVFLLYNSEKSYVNYPVFDLQFNDESIGWAETTNKALVGDWFHLVGVWRSFDGFIGLYMNGTLEDSNTFGKGKCLYYHDLYTTRIGHWGFPAQGGNRFLLGKLDDIRIYKRALTEDEIKVLYNERTSINVTEFSLPQDFKLCQNYPNPFNPETSISFQVPKTSHIKIDVFNLLGQHIRTLIDEEKAPGSYQIMWNGLDDQGKPVSSGVYLCKMQAGDFTAMKKMVLVR